MSYSRFCISFLAEKYLRDFAFVTVSHNTKRTSIIAFHHNSAFVEKQKYVTVRHLCSSFEVNVCDGKSVCPPTVNAFLPGKPVKGS